MKLPTVVGIGLIAFVPCVGAQQTLTRIVPDQYGTIQAAISTPGQVRWIDVRPGVYDGFVLDKSVAVRSTHGPRYTKIVGSKTPTVPTIQITRSTAEVRGFHIVGGVGVGIECRAASRVVDNVITGVQGGGGIACIDAIEPRIIGNIVSGCTLGPEGTARGAGIRCIRSSVLLANNLVFNNSAIATDPRAAVSEGGGIYCGPNDRLENCLVYGNTASAFGSGSRAVGHARGGGIFGGLKIANCIVWNNRVLADGHTSGAQLVATNVRHCCVQGGYPGPGNITADPQFVAPANGDFHLRATSPCIDAGQPGSANLPATDFEGDRRGFTPLEIGPDEFLPHVYVTGTVAWGQTIGLQFIGPPGSHAWLLAAPALRSTPLQLPELNGPLFVDPAITQIVPIGRMPASGVLSVPIALPSAGPLPATAWIQAVLGLETSPANVVFLR